MYKIGFGLIFIILFFSTCSNKKNDKIEIEQNLERKELIISEELLSIEKFPQVERRIINLLYLWEENEKFFNTHHLEIIFMEKVNLGIPSGDNWVVLWKILDENRYNNCLIIYSISDKIENWCYYGYGIINPNDETNFDIMKDIPGIHIPETGLSILDINGDEIEELVGYEFTGLGNDIIINSYNHKENKMVNLCKSISFDIVDKNNGPAPLEFINYRGKEGFKVYMRYGYYMNIPSPINLINNTFAWYFCAWDESEKKYIVMEEFLVDETELELSIYNYPLEYFEIQMNDFLSNTSGLRNFQEINPRVEGGRSFLATVYHGPTRTLSEEIFEFDQNGKMIYIK